MEEPINSHTEIWKIKTYIRHLNFHKGEDGSMLSLIIPHNVNIRDVCKVLDADIEKASKIVTDIPRAPLLDALRIALRLVSGYKQVPAHGVAIFTGISSKAGEDENRIKICIEPFIPIVEYFYTCDEKVNIQFNSWRNCLKSAKFHTEKLAKLLPEDENQTYGFIVLDSQDALFGSLQGTERRILHEFHFKISFGFFATRGDQGNRFAQKVAELATQMFITGHETNVDGLILSQSDRVPTNIAEILSPKLQEKIIRIVHFKAHGTKTGFNCAIKQSADVLAHVRYVQEDQLIERLFNEIVNSTKRFCFGLEDTIRFLHAGVIDTLLCWENLDITRVVVRNPDTEVASTLFLTPEQRRDHSLFKSQNEAETDLEIVDAQLLVLWLADNYRRLDFSLEIITGQSSLGEKFVKTLSGFGAILCVKRHDLGNITSSDASDYEV